MLANLFRKTKIISLSLGTALLFLTFIFYHNSFESLSENPLKLLGESAIKTFILIVTLIFLMVQEIRYRHVNVFPIHSLSAVLIVLFLPQGSIGFNGLIIQFFLVMTLHFISLICNTKDTLKPFFNLTLVLSVLAIFEPLFLWLFVGLVFLLLEERFRNLKNVMVIVIAFFICFIWARTIEHYFQLEPLFKRTNSMNFFDIKKIARDELLYIALIGSLVLIPIKKSLRRDYISNSLILSYLFIWLFLGIYISFFRGTTHLNPWELTLFPLLYLFGIFLNAASDKKVTVVVILLLTIKGLSLTVG